ncbi:MAG: alpha/beta hydrolase [Candidatus Eremiobacteraeota bacterium]|nr:alpha/beta hydrolase [Candidatus Eremiobacteraeota bacterium]
MKKLFLALLLTSLGWSDPILPQSQFVEVEPNVRLQVLDWGGSGPPLVLLAGLGDNAHVFDHFAHQFTDRFRVIGITRRGFGLSSQPETGYDVATRARDDLRVLDALGMSKAVFVGHSMAGDELSKLGADHPDRVEKLVYLDALEYGTHARLPQPPSPEYSDRDVASLELFSAANARFFGHRASESSMRETYRFDADGKVIAPVSPPEIARKMARGSQQADYARIKAPVLAIFAPLAPHTPGYGYLTPQQKRDFQRTYPPIVAWQKKAFQRFRKGIPQATVFELPGAYHYIYITNEAFVVEKMRNFLSVKSKERP